MANLFVKSSFGRLFAVVLWTAVSLVAGQTVFGQSTGFFFGAGGTYSMNAYSSVDFTDREWERRFQQAPGAFLMLGGTFGRVSLGVETGYEPKVYGVGFSADDVTAVTFHHIPMLLRISYSTVGAFSIKPNLFGGAALDFTNGTPEVMAAWGSQIIPAQPPSYDWRIAFGGGVDFSYAFPGDHIALFAGAGWTALLPLQTSSNEWYHYPVLRGGVLIHPSAGGGKGGARRSGSRVPVTVPSGPRPVLVNGGGSSRSGGGGSSYGGSARSDASAPMEGVSNNDLLANMRKVEAEKSAEARRQSSALQAVAHNDGPPHRSTPQDPIRVQMEQHIAEIDDLKREVRQQKEELAGMAVTLEEERKALEGLKRLTGRVKTIELGEDAMTPGSKIDTVYFFPNVASPMVMYSLPVVDEVGRHLQADSGLEVAIRGYSAPAGSPENQVIISESRARYCAEYLNKNFGIAYNRMSIEWFGAEKRPEQSNFYDNGKEGFFRAVELVTRPRAGSTTTALKPWMLENPVSTDEVYPIRAPSARWPTVEEDIVPPQSDYSNVSPRGNITTNKRR
ncbi:MAG: OmpA family protein [Spirochaetaceae bacterium]|jgi:outer membrane protein OmpA-like peptidoglycan-associated protein|nr:OmpA family protein [Spirochaetaceae bacterium]